MATPVNHSASDQVQSHPWQGRFTQPEGLDEAVQTAALAVLRSGRLHRYTLQEGALGEVSSFENEYAAWQGARYCLAVASGGQALQLALRATGLTPGSKVLTNGFTLAPVPGAIYAVGGQPVLVESDSNLCLDIEDLDAKTTASGARYLLVSHMRGHQGNMEKLQQWAQQREVTVIEDCAHTMGSLWNGQRSGNFGHVACFSTQTYKHLNSGEGGIICSNDPALMARATLMSGSYMLYERHGASPPKAYFEEAKWIQPNLSARMDALRAAILRPQLPQLEHNVKLWNQRHDCLHQHLSTVPDVVLPKQDPRALRVGSSIQFRIPSYSAQDCARLVQLADQQGISLKWFGASAPHGYTSRPSHWHYLNHGLLPKTEHILATLFDLRIPLSIPLEQYHDIGACLVQCIAQTKAK